MGISKKEAVNRVKEYMTSPKGGRKVSYRVGSVLIRWFCSTKYARKKYFRKKIRLIKTFLQSTEIGESSDDMIKEMLNAFFLKKWRIMAISNLNDRQFKKYIKIKNLDTFRKNYDKGKGILLVSSHYGLTEAAISLFPRLGFQDFYTVVGAQGAVSEKFKAINPKYESKSLVFDNFSDVELFKVLMKAKQILNDGGIIHLLGDGYHGRSSSTFTFIGKVRGFRGSYSELALSTGAEIIPIFIIPQKRGRILIDLRDPLDKGTDEMSREERNEYIVRQYVDQLEEAWKSNPQYVNWGHMEKYLHHIDKG